MYNFLSNKTKGHSTDRSLQANQFEKLISRSLNLNHTLFKLSFETENLPYSTSLIVKKITPSQFDLANSSVK